MLYIKYKNSMGQMINKFTRNLLHTIKSYIFSQTKNKDQLILKTFLVTINIMPTKSSVNTNKSVLMITKDNRSTQTTL